MSEGHLINFLSPKKRRYTRSNDIMKFWYFRNFYPVETHG